MIKNWKITSAFILGSIIVGFIAGHIKLNIHNIGGMIGSTVAVLTMLFLLPLLITYLYKIFYKLIKKDLKENEFVATYAVAWGIIVFLVLYGSSVGA